MADALHLRYQPKACNNCRYIRQHDQGPDNPCKPWACLLLGRLMSMISEDRMMDRVCDGWKRRPKSWGIWGHRVKSNTSDPFITDKSMKRIRVRVYRAAKAVL